MEFEKIDNILGNVSGMSTKRGKTVYDFIIKNKIQNILELGFAYGRSACYMAAALDEIGTGSIITMDLHRAKELQPNIFSLLDKAKLQRCVEPIFADNSYTWELMKIIEKNTDKNKCEPLFDFCYIDGGKSWDETGFGFFLVEKLLKPGGWILFDDLNWTYANDADEFFEDIIKKMPEEQKNTPQIGKAFSLLVKQHPNFHNFKDDGWWGWAQKKE